MPGFHSLPLLVSEEVFRGRSQTSIPKLHPQTPHEAPAFPNTWIQAEALEEAGELTHWEIKLMTELLRCGRWTFKGGVGSYWCKCILKFLNHWNRLTFRGTELQTPSSQLFCHAFPSSPSSSCIHHPKGSETLMFLLCCTRPWTIGESRGLGEAFMKRAVIKWEEKNTVPDVGQRQSLMMWVTLVEGAFFCFTQFVMEERHLSISSPTGLQWRSITSNPLGAEMTSLIHISTDASNLVHQRSLSRDAQSKSCCM